MSKRSSMYRDSRWQKKRLEIMERDNWTCRSCGASGDGVTLNVHHAYYEKGKRPWEYEDRVLGTLCEDCHKATHYWQRWFSENVCFMDASRKTQVAELLGQVFARPEILPFLFFTSKAASLLAMECWAGLSDRERGEGQAKREEEKGSEE